MGPISLVKSDSLLFPTGHSHFSFILFFYFFSFLLYFSFFLSSSFSVLLQSKISPTPKDKRISTLPIHGLSSPICLPFVILHRSHTDPSDKQLTNGSQSQTQTNASLEGSLGPPMTKPWATNASLKVRWTLIRDFRSDSIRLYRRSKRKKKKIYEMIVFVFVVNPTLLGLCFD